VKIVVLQHAELDSPGTLADWAAGRVGTNCFVVRLDKGHPLPSLQDFDWLVSLGGPMNVDEDAQYPWLAPEKALTRAAIQAGKHVLGICLGAQIIARALGAPVTKNPHPEIGWFPIQTTLEAKTHPVWTAFPVSATVFHWHGDTFEIPDGAVRNASSEACTNQAFTFGQRVLALQFHLEVGSDDVRRFVEDGVPEAGPYIQRPEQILENCESHAATTRSIFFALLDRFATA
jgi:GMP synthase (glutamine-hydrolysing)